MIAMCTNYLFFTFFCIRHDYELYNTKLIIEKITM